MTANAVKLGTSALPWRNTYSRFSMVAMIDAYVEGRPIPSDSSSLINAASVKRAGGSVSCRLGSTPSSCKPSAAVPAGCTRSPSRAAGSTVS